MSTPPPVFEFGPFRVDALRRALQRDGQTVPLPGKAFDILLVLAGSPGELVDKETLMREVWPDTAVEDNNLTVNISALRKALGETVAEQRAIITVPGRGYRFAGEIRSPEAPPPGLPSQPPAKGRDRRVAVLALTVAASAVAGLGTFLWLRPNAPQSIAVLPFRMLISDAGDEYLGMGLADAVITRLGNLHEVTVRPLASVSRLAGKDPFQAGVEANADCVLEGTAQVAGGRIRVAVRLLRVKDRSPLWAENFDESAASPFALEDSISSRVATSLVRHLSGEQKGALSKRYTSNAAAYGDYLRGRYYSIKYTEEGFQKALKYFQSAIDSDPAYALAYSGLADAYYDASNLLLPPTDAMPRAKAAALRAVELDPALAEAHVSLGLIASKYDWDWPLAEREFQTALSLDPNSSMAHQWYGLYRAQMGETARAVTEMHRALELDPLSNDANGYLSTALYWARRYDEALVQGRKVIQFDATYVPGYVSICWILAAEGKFTEAVRSCEEGFRVERSPWTTLALGRVRALAGDRGGAERELETLKESTASFVSGYDLAVVYAALGQTDKAFAALDDAYTRRAEWLGYLKVDPQLDALRGDPRFAKLVARMGL